jgi:two-component system sensor histidine kinase KdpD
MANAARSYDSCVNQTTAALALLLGVLVIAAVASRRVAIISSLIAFATFNFFFLAPVGTFAIAKRDDLVALLALLSVALIGSHLSQQVRDRAEAALVLERERNEAELARRNAEARSVLVASLSHDLKSPLTALTVAVGNLSSDKLSIDDRADQLEVARGELRRLQHLFDNVIDMASVEANAVRPEQEWVLASEIVEAARHQVAAAISNHKIELSDDTGSNLVELDPRMAAAALAHVLENAAAFAPKNTAVDVAARVASSRLVIQVRDRGPGIPERDLERIFDRGYSGIDGVARPVAGGMGLTIARALVGLQGGRISAANASDGGAIITLDFPVGVRPAPDSE